MTYYVECHTWQKRQNCLMLRPRPKLETSAKKPDTAYMSRFQAHISFHRIPWEDVQGCPAKHIVYLCRCQTYSVHLDTNRYNIMDQSWINRYPSVKMPWWNLRFAAPDGAYMLMKRMLWHYVAIPHTDGSLVTLKSVILFGRNDCHLLCLQQ